MNNSVQNSTQQTTARSILNISGIAICIGFSIFAQLLLDPQLPAGILTSARQHVSQLANGKNLIFIAMAIYAIVAFISALIAGQWNNNSIKIPARTPCSPSYVFISKFVGLGLLATSITAYLICMGIFTAKGESEIVRILWGFAVVGLLLSSAALTRKYKSNDKQENIIDKSPEFTWLSLTGLLLITLFALALRVYKLDIVPYNFHHDIANIGLQAREILLGRDNQIFALGWAVLPKMTFLPVTLAQIVFGDSLHGILMSSAVMGTLTIPALYLFVWRTLDNHRLATFSALTLAVTTSQIVYSHNPTSLDPWTYELWGLFFLIDGLRAKRNISLALSGALVGMSFQVYLSGRLGVFILVAFFIYIFLFQRKWITDNPLGVVFFILSGVLIVGPNLITFTKNGIATRSDAFVLGSPELLDHLMNKYQVSTTPQVLLEQIYRSTLMFNLFPDASAQSATYIRPMLTAYFSPFLWMGVAIAFRNIKKSGFFLMSATFVAGLTSSVLTSDPPYWPRFAMLMYVCPFFVAVFFEALFTKANLSVTTTKAFSPKKIGLLGPLIFSAILIYITLSGIQDWSYFEQTTENIANFKVIAARFTASLPQTAQICSFDEWPATLEREVLLMAYPRKTHVISASTRFQDIIECNSHGQDVWLLKTSQTIQLSLLKSRFPEGQVIEQKDAKGNPILLIYTP